MASIEYASDCVCKPKIFCLQSVSLVRDDLIHHTKKEVTIKMSYTWKKVKDKGERDWLKIGTIALICVIAGGVIAGLVTIDMSGLGEGVTYIPREGLEVPEGSKPVTLKMFCLHKLDRGNPAATPVRLYDANKVFFASASTADGLAAFTGVPIWEGETLHYQVRATAPSDTAYVTYMTKLIEFTVPIGDLSSIATVGPISLWELSTSVATFTVDDQDGNAVTGTTTNYLNTTDDGAFVRVSITEDCAFGTPADFTDHDTGKSYLGGAWMVARFTGLQDIDNAYTYYFDGSYHCYVFRLAMIVRSTALGYETGREFEISLGSGSTFVASANADFDIFDICQLNAAGGVDANSWKNGDSDHNPTIISSKVA